MLFDDVGMAFQQKTRFQYVALCWQRNFCKCGSILRESRCGVQTCWGMVDLREGAIPCTGGVPPCTKGGHCLSRRVQIINLPQMAQWPFFNLGKGLSF